MFLQRTIPSKAPHSDLMALKLAFNLIDHDLPLFKEIAMKLHHSIRRQSWYLAPPLICLAVADEDLPSAVKVDMVRKLLDHDLPSKGELKAAEPRLPKDYLLTSKTELVDFVNSQSYMLFQALKFTRDDLILLMETGPQTFDIGSNSMASMKYKEFCRKVSCLQVVNDMSERHIKLVQDYIQRSRKEDHRQDVFQVVKNSCSQFPVKVTKNFLSKKD